MLFVFFVVLTGNEDVIQINEKEIQPLTNRVHETLKRLGSIGQTHRHAHEFEETKRRDKSRFWNVIRVDRNLVISSDQVHL